MKLVFVCFVWSPAVSGNLWHVRRFEVEDCHVDGNLNFQNRCWNARVASLNVWEWFLPTSESIGFQCSLSQSTVVLYNSCIFCILCCNWGLPRDSYMDVSEDNCHGGLLWVPRGFPPIFAFGCHRGCQWSVSNKETIGAHTCAEPRRIFVFFSGDGSYRFDPRLPGECPWVQRNGQLLKKKKKKNKKWCHLLGSQTSAISGNSVVFSGCSSGFLGESLGLYLGIVLVTSPCVFLRFSRRFSQRVFLGLPQVLSQKSNVPEWAMIAWCVCATKRITMSMVQACFRRLRAALPSSDEIGPEHHNRVALWCCRYYFGSIALACCARKQLETRYCVVSGLRHVNHFITQRIFGLASLQTHRFWFVLSQAHYAQLRIWSSSRRASRHPGPRNSKGLPIERTMASWFLPIQSGATHFLSTPILEVPLCEVVLSIFINMLSWLSLRAKSLCLTCCILLVMFACLSNDEDSHVSWILNFRFLCSGNVRMAIVCFVRRLAVDENPCPIPWCVNQMADLFGETCFPELIQECLRNANDLWQPVKPFGIHFWDRRNLSCWGVLGLLPGFPKGFVFVNILCG